MSQQIINTGVADKGNGDPIRTAFTKVNANFAELYNQLAASVVVGAAAPSAPEEGSLWWNSESGRMYVYYGTAWVDASPVDGAGISSTNQLVNGAYTTSLGANGVLTLPDGSIINGSTIRGVAGTGELNYTGITIGPNSNDAEKTWMWVDHANAYITTNNAANTWTFGNNGSLTFPDTTAQTTAWTGSVSSLVNGANTVSLDANGNLTFPQGTLLGYSDPGGFIIDGAVDKDIAIYTYNGADAHGWTFGTDGSLTLPGDIRSEGNINIDINLSDSTLRRWRFGEDGDTVFPNNVSIDYSGNNVQFPRIIADSGKAFSVQGQGNAGSAALAWTVDPNAAGQYAAVSVSRAGGDNLAKVVLQAQSDSGDAATVKLWKFDETGELSLPTNGYTEAVIKELDATALVLFAQKAGANVKILAGATSAAGAKQWLFNGTNGRTTFPAASGPEHSYGATGDSAGMVAFDASYIYYCFASFRPLVAYTAAVSQNGGSTFEVYQTAGTPLINDHLYGNLGKGLITNVQASTEGGQPSWLLTVTQIGGTSISLDAGQPCNIGTPDIWKRTAHGAGTW